jgi:adenylate kinase family enzyme
VASSTAQRARNAAAGSPSCAVRSREAKGSALWNARRILVLGSSGSGKTHLATRLAAILDLELIHLDAQFWKQGWRPRSGREWRAKVSRLVEGASWIMDGTYERSLDLRIPRADAIILLECPRIQCLKRVFRRQIDAWSRGRSDGPRPIDANHLRYVWQYPAVTRPAVLESIERYGRGKYVVSIDGPEAVEPFLAAYQTQSAASGLLR